MTKKKAGISIIIILATLVLFIYTAVFGIGSWGSAENIKLGLDLSGGVSITYQTKEDNPSAEDMSDTVYKLQKRVESYSTESSVYQEGNNRINIEIPGVSDANKILTELGKPGSLQFIDPNGDVVVDGANVSGAEAGTRKNQMTGATEYVVSLQFDEVGTKAFAEATEKNIGNRIDIVYDGKTISLPVVNEAITGGQAEITGMGTVEDAQNLASSIRIGSLSLELEEIRSNVVGASLGQKALKTSLIAGAIGIMLVIMLLIFLYKIPGLIAGIALVYYTALDLVILSAFEITLTLPGIAGVILSIGMAVDANVIIYSRIGEELRNGHALKTAIENGFKKSFSAIIDGNITTLIAAFVLNMLGSGTVKGFAQTLAIGIVISMFTALVISKTAMVSLYELGLKDVKFFRQAKERKPIRFVEKRKLFFVIGLVAVLSGPVSMAVFKTTGSEMLNLSMDFKGGTSTNVTFKEDMTIEELEDKVKPIFEEIIGNAQVQFQKVAGTNEVYIKTNTLSVSQRQEITDRMEEEYGLKTKDIGFETISSTVSREMRSDAIIAVIVATICMLLYIWFRFTDFRFATSAVIALLHDVCVVFACYAIVRIPIGSTFIACMLTIVGYSINATIVIFDRIRENKKRYANTEMTEIVNMSITQTLSRSIYTSVTTFIMVAAIFVFGVSSIREFSLPIMVGIVAGGFSSICLAGPIWHLLKDTKNRKEKSNA